MIQQIKINAFKCIKDESIEFRPLTILTGLNNSGKSTVLQAILLAVKFCNSGNTEKMAPFVAMYQHLPKDIELKIDNDWIVLTDNKIHSMIRKKIKFEDNLYFLQANRLGPEQIINISNEYKVGLHGEYLFGSYMKYILDQKSPDKIKIIDKTFPTNIFIKILQNYLKTLSYRLSIELNGNSHDEIGIQDFEDELLDLLSINRNEDAYREIINSFDLSSKLNIWLSYITEMENYLIVRKIDDEHGYVSYIREDCQEITPFNVGDGTSYLAKILILCFLANRGDTIIIENPAIHLHPAAQSRLGEFFAFMTKNGVQIIIETHCEHLINNIRYQVYSGVLPPEDVIIHYKSGVSDPFAPLTINSNGQFMNSEIKEVGFPRGFFDASLDKLLEMG